MEADERHLERLMDSLTKSPAKDLNSDVDSARMKSLKNLVRSSPSIVSAAVRLLMDRMNKNHSQVRYLAVLIVNELFMRSKLFRSILVQSFPRFLLLSLGFRRENPLPPPEDRASLLRSRTLEFLQTWNERFGPFYKQLRLGYQYLKNTLRISFPDQNTVARSLDQRVARTQELLREKFRNLTLNFASYKGEIRLTVEEIGECVEMLGKGEDGDEDEEDEGVSGFEYGGSLGLRRIREEALKEGKRPVESRENEAVFDVVRELYKLLTTRHGPAIQEWLFVLMRVDVAERRGLEEMLKEVIDLRNKVRAAKAECEGLGCKLSVEDVEEDVVWEEGVIARGDYDDGSCDPSGEAISAAAAAQFSSVERAGAMETRANHNAGKSSSLKQKLAKEAPVLPWGSYLDVWGSSSAIPANQRGLEIESHWGRVDMDAVIPHERASELNIRATYYKDQQPEIQPCRAPLRKGGFCQRRDLRVCPLHGPIRPRDSSGNPIDEKPDSMGPKETSQTGQNSGRKDSALECQTEDIVRLSSQLKRDISEEQTTRLIAAQAVDNVRSRDEAAKKRKQADHSAARRAKLAKVREHNNSVLRNSAMASGSQGLGETLGEDLEGWSCNKNQLKRQKQTLSSLLKKKPSVKDRLAQKLLNTKASEATVRQVMKDDVAKYRESFANQW